MSNLLKQCFVVNSTQGNRIINSDQHMKERMAGEGRSLSEEPEGELTGSADEAEEESLPSYEEEKVKLEQLRKDRRCADDGKPDHFDSSFGGKRNLRCCQAERAAIIRGTEKARI